MEKSSKPIASCALPAAEGMSIKTNTKMVEKARKSYGISFGKSSFRLPSL